MLRVFLPMSNGVPWCVYRVPHSLCPVLFRRNVRSFLSRRVSMEINPWNSFSITLWSSLDCFSFYVSPWLSLETIYFIDRRFLRTSPVVPLLVDRPDHRTHYSLLRREPCPDIKRERGTVYSTVVEYDSFYKRVMS